MVVMASMKMVADDEDDERVGDEIKNEEDEGIDADGYQQGN